MRFYPRSPQSRQDALASESNIGNHGTTDDQTARDRQARYDRIADTISGTGAFNESDVVNGLTKATGTLTLTPGAISNDKVKIDTTWYVFAAAINDGAANGSSSHPWQVKVGASDTLSLANLLKAINATGTPTTDYSTALTAHATVEGLVSDATSLAVRARTAGTAGNAISTTVTVVTTDDGLAWGGITLTNGFNAVVVNIDVTGDDAFKADAISAFSTTLIASVPTTDGLRAALTAGNFALSNNNKRLTLTLPAIGAYTIGSNASYDFTFNKVLFLRATANKVVTAALTVTDGA